MLENDPRWQALKATGWTCVSCDELHHGLFALVAHAPDVECPPRARLGNAAAGWSNNMLSEDFCIVGGKEFLIRAQLELPIVGSNTEVFTYGIWVSLSKTSFTEYRSGFQAEQQSHRGPWFGWFSNNLAGYPDTFGLKTMVHPQDGGLRPLIELELTDHPLSIEQHNGITLDRVIEIYTLHGHPLAV